MRAFLISLAAIVVIAVGSLFLLGSVQQSSGAAYSTQGTRISASFLRRMAQAASETAGMKKTPTAAGGLSVGSMTGQQGEETCEAVSAWRTVFMDFGEQVEDPSACGT